jgi:hypothetical protein
MDERAKNVDTAIKQIWDSLESHLDCTHQDTPEGRKFHKQCIKDYAKLLIILTKLY